MMIADASAALTALLNAGSAREALGSEQLHVPHLIDPEIADGLRRMVVSGEVESGAGRAVLGTWRRIGVVRYPIVGLLGRIWELRENLSTYDASYVALAEQLGCALLTADRRLSRAPGVGCPITLVPG